MILYSNLYEREGNDAWLKDYVELHRNDLGLYIDHKVRWTGWGEPINENYTLELDENDLEKSQILLDEYLDRHSLEEEMKINLKELVNNG